MSYVICHVASIDKGLGPPIIVISFWLWRASVVVNGEIPRLLRDKMYVHVHVAEVLTFACQQAAGLQELAYARAIDPRRAFKPTALFTFCYVFHSSSMQREAMA